MLTSGDLARHKTTAKIPNYIQSTMREKMKRIFPLLTFIEELLFARYCVLLSGAYNAFMY